MNQNLAILLISLSCGALSILALLRFIMQLARVDFFNKVVQVICRITDVYCSPLRKLLPYNQYVDFATIIMAVLMQLLGLYLIYFLYASRLPNIADMLSWSALIVVGLSLRVYFMALLLTVIFSWVRPQGATSFAELSNQLVRPLLKPLHKLIPPMAGLDFSPMVLFFLVYLLQSFWRSIAFSMEIPLKIVFGL